MKAHITENGLPKTYLIAGSFSIIFSKFQGSFLKNVCGWMLEDEEEILDQSYNRFQISGGVSVLIRKITWAKHERLQRLIKCLQNKRPGELIRSNFSYNTIDGTHQFIGITSFLILLQLFIVTHFFSQNTHHLFSIFNRLVAKLEFW